MKKQFSREFKIAILREFEAGKTMAEICRTHDLKHDMVYRWSNEYQENPEKAFSGKGNVSTLEARNAELERLVGRLYEENVLLKKALQGSEKILMENKKQR